MGLVRKNEVADLPGATVAQLDATPGTGFEPQQPADPSTSSPAEPQTDDFHLLQSALATRHDGLPSPATLQEFIATIERSDAEMRSRLINTLKTLSLDLAPVLKILLVHPDPNMRIFAIGLLEFRCANDVEQHLLQLIEREQDLRVCATALDLLCEVATQEALGSLERLRTRFTSDAYIQFAVALALDRIRDPA